jgi:20S proteasome alpha/beta subunit
MATGMLRSRPRSRPLFRLLVELVSFIMLAVACNNLQCQASDMDGRYSYSLTTFDPNGKLGQVERAMQAASMGAPVVALVRPDEIIMACPQVLPSPLIEDDGTSRFARVTKEIVIAHTGLSADGRVLIAAAQRMAVEHEYTFDETIPIDLFLEGLSLLFQEYTMKPAARPFGAMLVVGYVPSPETRMDSALPQIYRIDPSGGVESLGNHAVVNGNLGRTDLKEGLKRLGKNATNSSMDDARQSLVAGLKSALTEQATRTKRQETTHDFTILTVSLSRGGKFTMRRHEPSVEQKLETSNKTRR